MIPLTVLSTALLTVFRRTADQFTCESGGMIIHVKSVAKHKITEAVVELPEKKQETDEEN